jgi:hypothetical protein
MKRHLSWQSRWVVLISFGIQSLIYGFGLSFVLQIIPDWGKWYSASPFYSLQANALLRRDFALTHRIMDLDHDLVWSNGGIHQVWGLGVPLLRLPLTALAHMCGYSVFPDYLALGLALSLTAFLLLHLMVGPAVVRRKWFAIPIAYGGVALALFFPPFLALLHTRLKVYEEAVVYTYLFGLIEAVFLFRFLITESKAWWILLMLLAGFGIMVRPTLVFYGLAAWVIGTAALFKQWKRGKSTKNRPTSNSGNETTIASKNEITPAGVTRYLIYLKSIVPRVYLNMWLVGTVLFVLGIGLLLFTNWKRFGSPLEFGHKLNVQLEICDGSLYATRFSHPFETAPLGEAARELLGALFFSHAPYQVVEDFYSRKDLFWGQSKIPRMRELYCMTYDWTYLIPLLGSAGFVLMLGWRALRGRLRRWDTLLMNMGLWSLAAVVPLFWFYLRTPALASRYLLDFAPGFAVLMVVGWHAMVGWSLRDWRKFSTLLLFVGFWMNWEVTSVRNGGEAPYSRSWKNVSSILKEGDEPKLKQARLGSRSTKSGESGIPYDGIGWNKQDGSLMPFLAIVVKDADFLELSLSRNRNNSEAPDPHWVRAKIGLEFLERSSITTESNVFHIRFNAPKRPYYRHSIQLAFLAVVPEARLADKSTPWILHEVRWRHETLDASAKATERSTL